MLRQLSARTHRVHTGRARPGHMRCRA
jgi:hypothetical protein